MKNVISFPIRQRSAFPTASRSLLSVKQTYLWLRVLLNVGPTVQQRNLAVDAFFDLADRVDCDDVPALDLIAARMEKDWEEKAEGHPNLIHLWAAQYNNVVRRSIVKLPWRRTTGPTMFSQAMSNPVNPEIAWPGEV